MTDGVKTAVVPGPMSDLVLVKAPIKPTAGMIEAANEMADVNGHLRQGPERVWRDMMTAWQATHQAATPVADTQPETANSAGQLAELEQVLLWIDAMTKKHGNPNGSDYEQGVTDHGFRIRGKVVAMIDAAKSRSVGIAAGDAPIPHVNKPSLSAEPVAWRWRPLGLGWKVVGPGEQRPYDAQPLYASPPIGVGGGSLPAASQPSVPTEGQEQPWADLERLAMAATPGDWHLWCACNDDGGHPYHGVNSVLFLTDGKSNLSDDVSVEDGSFIAAANPATVLELIAAARANSVGTSAASEPIPPAISAETVALLRDVLSFLEQLWLPEDSGLSDNDSHTLRMQREQLPSIIDRVDALLRPTPDAQEQSR